MLDWDAIKKQNAYIQPKTTKTTKKQLSQAASKTVLTPALLRNAPALTKITPEQQAKNQAIALQELQGPQGNIASLARGVAGGLVDPYGILKAIGLRSNTAQEQASAKNTYNIPALKNPRAVSQGLKPEIANITGTYEGLGEFGGSAIGVDPVAILGEKAARTAIGKLGTTTAEKIPVLANGKIQFKNAPTATPESTVEHTGVYNKEFSPVSKDNYMQSIADKIANTNAPMWDNYNSNYGQTVRKQLDEYGAELDKIQNMTTSEWNAYAKSKGLGSYGGKIPSVSKNATVQEPLQTVTPTITKANIPPQAPAATVQPRKSNLGAEISKEQQFVKNGNVSQPGKIESKLKDLGADVNRFEEVAMVTNDSKQLKPTLLERTAGITSNLKRKFVDAGDTVAKMAKINNDQGLYNLYNNARNSRRRAEYQIGEAQTDITGRAVGKSLKDIFDPIRKKGDNYYEDFQEYMYHLHNIDRMAQNKPVFGESITANESKLVSDYLLNQHPEFAQEAADVRKYLDNMMQYRVQGGLVSEDSAKALNEMYRNYVPTYRVNPSTKGARYSGQITDIKTGIKKATGSSKDLLPLHEQISKQTMQAVDAAHKNLFGIRLAENINPKTQQFVQELKKIDDAFDVDADAIPELKNTFNIYENGKSYQMKVDDTLYEGIKALVKTDPNELAKAALWANRGFKQLITSFNPMFLIRNAARDIQDVGLYSKDLKSFANMYPGAIKEITTNGTTWKQYKALGGAGNSFFDYAKGYKKDASWLKKNTLNRIESLNMATEQLPRFTEFMSTINKLGRSPTYDELMQAMYNSADVTVNFGRSGTWGKTLNSTFVPFFNPAMQGADKLIRKFTETKGVKGWAELVLKISALGVAPSLLNEMVYHDDPQYAMINDRDKDINFIFKVGDGEFIKIPKGRVLSMFGAGSQRLYRAAQGDENAFAGYLKTTADQVAPISPTESNILSPIAAVRNNKSWYGGKIEPQRLEKYSPGLRYDESTTAIAKTLGKVLDYSPKKIDYLLDSYSGVIGDFAMPLTTLKAEKNPFVKAFTIDSVLSNKISQQFYDKKDEIYYAKNDAEGEDKYDILNRYMTKQSDNATELYNEIREIENSSISDKAKREKVREVKALINGIEQTALDTVPQVEKAAKNLSSKYTKTTDLYREVNKKVFGAEYSLKTYNKDVYEKAQKYKAAGLSYDDFYTIYFGTKDITADTRPNGNVIDNSASRKKKEYIDNAFPNASSEKLKLLYEMAGVAKTVGHYRPQFD